MTNKEIAKHFNDLAAIMDLHQENPFKIKSYRFAYQQIRKQTEPLVEMTPESIANLKGIGKSVTSQIQELLKENRLSTYEKYLEKTPKGIVEMLTIKGLGVKKIRTIWKELGIESLGELRYACLENRLVKLNGFGAKTQADIIKKVEYFLQSKGKLHYAKAEIEALEFIKKFSEQYPSTPIEFTGELRRRCPIISQIELIAKVDAPLSKLKTLLALSTEKEDFVQGKTEAGVLISIHLAKKENYATLLLKTTGSEKFLTAIQEKAPSILQHNSEAENTIFENHKINFVPPELREDGHYLDKPIPNLIEQQDLKGIIHAHTTYSDGVNTLEEMATYAKNLGYSYIVITDHSQAAFYANGLKPNRVIAQMEAIDKLNESLTPFKIYKGIESDILNDGSLDYSDEILSKFDMVIASIHSNLKMDKTTATSRLLKAIQNPYTTMLGHPTGRLLLSRQGYPIDHTIIIDACAKYGVAIELNANPYRLDIDYTWIPYAVKKGVKISINPDAHSLEGIHDTQYGVWAARKGGLTKHDCFNAFVEII